MQVISATILLFAWFVARSLVAAQDSWCPFALYLARQTANPEQCNCPHPPSCNGECLYGDIASCSSGCYFCDSLGICGYVVVVAGYGVAYIPIGDDMFPMHYEWQNYTWYYVKGRTGTLTYYYTRYDDSCRVIIDGEECASCVLHTCDKDNITSVEPAIDCSNLDAGATASDPCSGRAFGGWASLDDSALNGILAPLALPYYGCHIGTTHVAKEGEVPLPSSKPNTASSVAPVTTAPYSSESGPVATSTSPPTPPAPVSTDTSAPMISPTTATPSPGPTISPTTAPPTPEPTISATTTPPTPRPTISPTPAPPTPRPTISPTKAPTTPGPTISQTEAPSTSGPMISPTDALNTSEAMHHFWWWRAFLAAIVGAWAF